MDRATMEIVYEEMKNILNEEVKDPKRRDMLDGGTMARTLGLLKQRLDALETAYLEERGYRGYVPTKSEMAKQIAEEQGIPVIPLNMSNKREKK